MSASRSECRSWQSISDLLCDDLTAGTAFLGVPLGEKSLTPGRCDLAPQIVRKTLPRISTYDLESEAELAGMRVHDAGDLYLKTRTPEEAFEPIRDKIAELAARHDLSLIMGGNNAITRPGVHGLGDLTRTGLITFDAHFDLRDTDCGLLNGNPVQALLEDGLPGENIVQIGLQPFANTKRMHDKAKAAGIRVHTMADVLRYGLTELVDEALIYLSDRLDHIYVDFDIDVIDRASVPGAPGARPGGMHVMDFFAAARQICTHPKVRAVDLTEFDPSLDVADQTALVAGRFIAECLAGFDQRV